MRTRSQTSARVIGRGRWLRHMAQRWSTTKLRRDLEWARATIRSSNPPCSYEAAVVMAAVCKAELRRRRSRAHLQLIITR